MDFVRQLDRTRGGGLEADAQRMDCSIIIFKILKKSDFHDKHNFRPSSVYARCWSRISLRKRRAGARKSIIKERKKLTPVYVPCSLRPNKQSVFIPVRFALWPQPAAGARGTTDAVPEAIL
ncbi:hypothetical protein EVAR_102139_1 [Eumeta japonica]|uniref:Uncharacterized protein n=1 Tax=Eumeta variegata TaxID=151549 RepID=A0A4C1TZS1_EUMVA|nr:hypothetical protein EVAR_102139_1 [Eumeta japonica]